MKTILFEPERYVRTPEAQAHLLADAIASGDQIYLADVLGVISRAYDRAGRSSTSAIAREPD